MLLVMMMMMMIDEFRAYLRYSLSIIVLELFSEFVNLHNFVMCTSS